MMDDSQQHIQMCEKAVEMQKAWEPCVGDWVWRKYTVFGKEIDNQVWGEKKCQEIIVLHFKSIIDGYWAAINDKGEERIFKTPGDLAKATSIWLPRQDQLQAMVGEYKDVFDLMCDFGCEVVQYGSFEGIPEKYWADFTSMEQFWLALVMTQKYGKRWNGEDWINDGSKIQINSKKD